MGRDPARRQKALSVLPTPAGSLSPRWWPKSRIGSARFRVLVADQGVASLGRSASVITGKATD